MPEIVLDYRPRKAFRAFHERTQRWAVLVCHRRAGKTVALLNDCILRAVKENKKDGRYALIYPQRNQAKTVAWPYLKRFAAPLLRKPPNESDLYVELIGGQTIRLFGSDNPDSLRGGYLDGVGLDEYAQHVSWLWAEVIRAMLADRNGWAVFAGTPKGKNAFHTVYSNALKAPDSYFTMNLKASASGILSQQELDDIRRDENISDDQYNQEFENSFEAAIKGAFYADEMRAMAAEGRIRNIPVEKAVRVHTSWDLGMRDSTAIVFWQCVGRERRVIDYYESSGVGLDVYAAVLHQKRSEHGWTYGEHLFPHDLAVKELNTGRSRADTMRSLGIEPQIVPQHSVLDGINATRRMLGRTHISSRCERLIEALRQYRREWDERLKDWKANPLHDWTSHGCDGVRTFAAGFDDPAAVTPSARRRERGNDGASAWSA